MDTTANRCLGTHLPLPIGFPYITMTNWPNCIRGPK